MAQMKCLFAFTSPADPRYVCEWHDHPCTEIVFTGQTAGILLDGDRRIQFGPHEVFTYQPGTRHNVEMRVAGSHVCIGARGCGAEQLPVGAWSASDVLAQHFLQCVPLINQFGPMRETHLDLLAGLIVVEMRSQLQPAADKPALDVAEHAKEVIDTRFNEKLSLSEIASDLYISPDYLRQLFRKRFGLSPIHYLLHRRIEAAQLLLTSTALSVQEIGRRCGFENPYYFSRMFRKLAGRSPSEFRRSH